MLFLQEPTVVIGMSIIACLLVTVDLGIKELKKKREMKRRILASIKETKEKDPNAICLYGGKIY